MKTFTKFLGVALAFALMLSGVAVSAQNYASIQGTTTELTKYMVVDKEAEIPEVSFGFEVSAGSAIEATENTVKVWAGLNPELVKVNGTAKEGGVSFEAGEATTDGELTGVATADEKYAEKTIELDFTGVTYSEPGVYRYLLTEKSTTNDAVSMDEEPVRTIDVYVEDVDGVLTVTSYVSYEGTVVDAPKNVTQPELTEWEQENPEPKAEDYENEAQFEEDHEAWETAKQAEIDRQALLTPNGAEAALPKSDKFVNRMDSADIYFGKEVTGNQGSKDQYFKFTLTLNNLGKGTVLTMDMSDAEVETHANTATSYTTDTMNASNARDDDSEKANQQIIADDNGSATVVVYLHDGQYVTLKGLPNGATYELAEENTAGYTKINGITASENGTRAYEDAVSGTIGDKEDTITGYKLANNPTGNAISIEEYEALSEEGKLGYEPVTEKADQDIYTGYTNSREGVIPTGLVVSIAGGFGLVALAGAGLILSSRRKYEE